MVSLANNLDGVDGVTITPANSGGALGNAFDTCSVGAGSILRYSAAGAAHGAACMEFSTGAVSESAFVQWLGSLGGTITDGWYRWYLNLSALPLSTSSIFASLLGASVRARIQITTLGKLRVLNAAAGAVWTGATTLSLATSLRVEARLLHDAAAGAAQVVLYPGDSATPIDDSGALSGIAFGGATADRIRFGCVANQINFPSTRMDDIAFRDAGGFIGPYVPPAPVASNVTQLQSWRRHRSGLYLAR